MRSIKFFQSLFLAFYVNSSSDPFTSVMFVSLSCVLFPYVSKVASVFLCLFDVELESTSDEDAHLLGISIGKCVVLVHSTIQRCV